MNDEIWLPITGYEGLYEVSNLGRVRSLGARARVLRPGKRRDGYVQVFLSKNGKGKTCRVHRLVATAHIPNPLNLPQVNHKNEVKTDNQVENLEWCDVTYNNNYGTRNERIADALSIPVLQYTPNGEFVAWYPSTMEAGRRTGVSQGSITQCASGKCKTQGGYQWRYEPALFLDPTEGRFNKTDSKRVYQYELDGRFVKEWPSVMEIERKTGWSRGNIAQCCNGKFYQRYGFRWFYTYQGTNLNKPAPTHTEQECLF